jgi:hypothetical protein
VGGAGAVEGSVDVILLSYNRLDYLVEMVTALEQRTLHPYRLTIVDNASGAETRQWLRENATRFHQVIWNERNEHLAGLQRGIAATSSELFVISDADLVVGEPVAGRCWLGRLVELAERHRDFGLIGARLDSVSAARNARLAGAPVIDGELLETATGVWLNLIRREALQIPYASDGITCYALRRSGYRVGIAADVLVTHLGDRDPQRHPDYLARKQGASGWRTVYPDYPELGETASAPTLRELALAAGVLEALARHGVAAQDVLELDGGAGPVLAAATGTMATVEPGELVAGIAPAIAIVADPGGLDTAVAAAAFAGAGAWVVILTGAGVPAAGEGFALVDERPGPHPVVLALARIGSRRGWRRTLGLSTLEYRERWLALFAAACFGDDPALRVYVFKRANAAPAPSAEAKPNVIARPTGRRPRKLRVRRRRFGALVTKARRLVWAEWELRRRRGRG